MARKEKKAGPPTMSLVFVGMLCFFAAASGAGFLWNKAQIHALGEQIRGYEIRLDSARRHRRALEGIYATNCAPAYLDYRVRAMKLDLGLPQPDQIVRLTETSGAAQEEKLLAGRTMPNAEGRN
jgi:hypothetical protein